MHSPICLFIYCIVLLTLLAIVYVWSYCWDMVDCGIWCWLEAIALVIMTVNMIYSRRPTCHIYVEDDDIVKAEEVSSRRINICHNIFWLIKLGKTSKQECGLSEPSETLDIGIVSVKSRIFLDPIPGLGIGPVQCPEPRPGLGIGPV